MASAPTSTTSAASASAPTLLLVLSTLCPVLKLPSLVWKSVVLRTQLAACDGLLHLLFLFLYAQGGREPLLAFRDPSFDRFRGIEFDGCALDWDRFPERPLLRQAVALRRQKNAPLQAGVSIPVISLLPLVPPRRIDEMSVHHVYLHRLLRALEATSCLRAVAVARLVPVRLHLSTIRRLLRGRRVCTSRGVGVGVV